MPSNCVATIRPVSLRMDTFRISTHQLQAVNAPLILIQILWHVPVHHPHTIQHVNELGATPSMCKTFGCLIRLDMITSLQYFWNSLVRNLHLAAGGIEHIAAPSSPARHCSHTSSVLQWQTLRSSRSQPSKCRRIHQMRRRVGFS